MPEPRHCAECGAPLPEDAPDGVCPACSLGGALALSPSNPGAPPPLFKFRYFGDYELLEEIARGGMGVVYKARQVSLNRTVAIKMILAGHLAGAAQVQRFRAEAEAAANLRHPNIVAIYEVGEHEGQHYFSMEYVEGKNLAALVRENPLPARRAADYVKTLAEAIHYAHQRGTLHRDLKPSNVLVDIFDQPRITDFGLAKQLTDSHLSAPDSQLTVTGQVLGSPNFMPPEQAGGKRAQVGPPSDIYSLGAILYHLLTGRPPFAAATLETTLALVLNDEAVSPRLLNSGVPRDLETIALKCLEKDPQRRYRSAQELADELGRYLRGEPIRARPVSPAEKVWRWSRRNPRVASLSAALACVLVLAFAGGFWDLQRVKAKAEQDRRRLVRFNVATGVRLMDEGDLLGALPSFAQALKLDEGRRAEEEIHRLRLGTLLNQCPRLLAVMPHDGTVTHAEFSPDGRRIVSGSRDGTARVWDAITGEAITPPLSHGAEVIRVGFSSDGKRVLTVGGKQVHLWDAATGRPVLPPLEHPHAVQHAAFSPDGKRLLSVNTERFVPGEVRLWDALTGQPVLPPITLNRESQYAAFSPDGRLLAIATGITDQPGRIEIRDASTGAVVGEPMNPNMPVLRVEFSSDGQRLLSAAGNLQFPGAAQVWDVATQKALTPPMKHPAQVNVAVFSPDGTRVVTASHDKTARVWDALTGEPVTPPLAHDAWVMHAAFSPDGRFVVTCGPDLTARVWRADTGEPVGSPLRHWGAVLFARFSPDGLRLLTVSEDRLVRVWDVVATPPAATLLLGQTRTGAGVRRVAFSPDGKFLVTGAGWGECRMWEVASGRPVRELQQHTNALLTIRFSPNGHQLLTTSHDGTAQLWDAATGRTNAPPMRHSNWVYSAVFSPNGQRVVTVSVDRTARVWNTADGQPVTPPLIHEGQVFETDFRADGRQFLTLDEYVGAADRTLHFWDADTGAPRMHRVHHGDVIFTARYSPDSARIVTGSRDQTARVWDATTWQPLTPPFPHNGAVTIAVFSPEGRRVLTASDDNTARVWDATTGQSLTPPMKHAHLLIHAEFSRDGRLVLTTSWDTTARVWDAATGEPITPPLRHRANRVEHGAFSPDGHWVATGGFDPEARLWELIRTDRAVADLVNQSHLLAGSTASEGGEFVPLTALTVRSTWQALRAKHPDDYGISREQALAWHRREAEASENAQQWFAALFHLDQLLAGGPADEELRKRRELAAERANPVDAREARKRELKQLIPARDPRARPELIDLSEFYNATLATNWLRGNTNNHLASLPQGLQTFAGTEFDVRGIIQLTGAGLKERAKTVPVSYPERVSGIPVRRKCARLHFLHNTAWPEAEGTPVGSYILSYASGLRVELPIVYGRDVSNVQLDSTEPAKVQRAVNAWTGTNAGTLARGYALQLFKSTWENPLPEQEIETIEFVSALSRCAPFLIAITVE